MLLLFFFPFLSRQEDYDQVSLEDQHYQGDSSMLGSKAKLPLRDSKKELLRYVGLDSEASHSILLAGRRPSIDEKKCQLQTIHVFQ